MNPASQRFFGSLESLRGVAALIVVLYHVNGWGNPVTNCLFVRNGYLMVDLFFVLSGFVICHNYFQKINGRRDLAGFMLLRFGRLYPLHLFFLCVFLGLETVKMVAELKTGFVPTHSQAFSVNNASSFLAHLLFMQSFFAFSDKTFDTPSWSIGVEFYTYLLFGLLILVVGRRRIVPMAGLLVAGAIVLLHSLGFSGLHVMNGAGSLMRCWLGFFTGVLVYQMHLRHHPIIVRHASKLGWVVLAATGILLALKAFDTGLDYLTVLLFGSIVIFLATPTEGSLAKLFNLHPLRWLGKVSYSIYLSHELVLIFMGRMLTFAEKLCLDHFPHIPPLTLIYALGLLFVCLTVAIVLIVSHLTYNWIEVVGQKRFRDLAIKWFKPKPARNLAQPVQKTPDVH